MHLKKYIGCLLATGLATTSAFAAEWFTTTIAAEPTSGQGTWTLPTTGTWTYDTVGKLNSPVNSPEGELTFVATTVKALPGDESTISTSVKFTAMDKADFLVDGNLPAIPTGAKGGLTIIEDSDVNPATTKFYGIVGGAWVELEGNTTAALAGQVNVEVKIWENNGKHISYKVGEQPLTLDGESDLTASFTGSTVSSVSYKGVCEIASLQGAAQDELWTLTLKTIADVQSVLYKVGDGAWTAVPQDNKIKATTENVQVKYVAEEGKYFFPDIAGAGVTELEGTATKVDGDADLSDDAALANVSTAIEAVAEVVEGGSGKFASIAAAVGAGSAVNVLKDVDESVTIGKTLTLTANENVDISGTFTWGTGGALTIESGAYDCEFAGFTPETLIFKGGCYKQSATEVQPFCATKYFATTMTGTYETSVDLGQDVSLSGAPDMSVGKDIVAAAGGADKVADYLAQETAGSGSIKRWQSYALGLGTVPTAVPEFGVDNDNDAANINLTKNFEVLKSTGVEVSYQVDEGEPTAEVPALSISGIGTGVTKKTVKVFTGDVLAGSTTIGANKVAAPAAGTRSLVTVPWADSARGTGVKVADLFKKASLVGGEKLELYDQASDTYTEWTFSGGAWSDTTESLGIAEAKDPAETFVKKGQALWFTGTAAAVQFGVDSMVPSTTPVIAGKWGFAANPISAASKTLSDIIAASSVPSAQVQLTDKSGKTVIYFNNGTSWGYNTVVNRKRQFTAVDPAIAPGQEFWFDNKGGSSADLAW